MTYNAPLSLPQSHINPKWNVSCYATRRLALRERLFERLALRVRVGDAVRLRVRVRVRLAVRLRVPLLVRDAPAIL